MYNGGSPTLVNSILWGNSPDEIYNNGSSAPAVTYSDVQGGYAGTGNINADPLFVAPITATAAPTTTGNYRVHYNSPAIDAGSTLSVTAATDLDGHPRVMGKAVDMGAYEVGLTMTKRAYPNPVQAGAPLTYTISVTNYYADDLHSTITDTLPASVTPGGLLTWTPVISASDGTWVGTFAVMVTPGYFGMLTNRVQLTTEEGPSGIYTTTTLAFGYQIYLPITFKN